MSSSISCSRRSDCSKRGEQPRDAEAELLSDEPPHIDLYARIAVCLCGASRTARCGRRSQAALPAAGRSRRSAPAPTPHLWRTAGHFRLARTCCSWHSRSAAGSRTCSSRRISGHPVALHDRTHRPAVRRDGMDARHADGRGTIRIDRPFDARLTLVTDTPEAPAGRLTGSGPIFVLTHEPNNSVIAVNRLLKAGARISWARSRHRNGNAIHRGRSSSSTSARKPRRLRHAT